MTAVELLEDTRKRGILLSADGGDLVIDAPAGMVTDELRAALREHKMGLLAAVAVVTAPDWNTLPDGLTGTLFGDDDLEAINAGSATPIWSTTLAEWMWWVRDEAAKARLEAEGCTTIIYTLAELAHATRVDLETFHQGHAWKRDYGARIDPLPVDVTVCGLTAAEIELSAPSSMRESPVSSASS